MLKSYQNENGNVNNFTELVVISSFCATIPNPNKAAKAYFEDHRDDWRVELGIIDRIVPPTRTWGTALCHLEQSCP